MTLNPHQLYTVCDPKAATSRAKTKDYVPTGICTVSVIIINLEWKNNYNCCELMCCDCLREQSVAAGGLQVFTGHITTV